MSEARALASNVTGQILRRFGMRQDLRPNGENLNALLGCYTRHVPWESASRIVRRARHQAAQDCPLFAESFWESALHFGTGGTCYESNYAFFSFLRRLGYEGYLTINDMGTAIGCHSAIIIWLDGQKVMVDVGLPIYALLPLPDQDKIEVQSPFFHYELERLADNHYNVWRHPHPRSHAFTLIDEPVSDSHYRQITSHDYRHDGGQFLQEIVINKVIDDQIWRFNSDDKPLHLQQFVNGQRRNHALGVDAPGQMAECFGIAPDVVAEAMAILSP